MKLILGSASERRAELLNKIITDFEIVISDFDESSITFSGNCSKYVIDISLGKAINVSKKLHEDAIIIACDTVVFFNDTVLGKPSNDEAAFDMLSKLSGNSHLVYSGLTVYNTKENKTISDYQMTNVKFSKLTKNQILEYIKTGEPMDKAGGYGIQGKGGIFVEKISGCYYNVVGLPINKLYYLLRDMGVNLN
jgi:septum formation protein